MKIENGYKLFDDTYLFEINGCLAVAKVNEKGEIIRLTTFGEKELTE